jgi:hypothetical protein
MALLVQLLGVRKAVEVRARARARVRACRRLQCACGWGRVWRSELPGAPFSLVTAAVVLLWRAARRACRCVCECACACRDLVQVGVFTGYSSLAVALVLPPDGRLFALDRDASTMAVAQRYWAQAGVADKVCAHAWLHVCVRVCARQCV